MIASKMAKWLGGAVLAAGLVVGGVGGVVLAQNGGDAPDAPEAPPAPEGIPGDPADSPAGQPTPGAAPDPNAPALPAGDGTGTGRAAVRANISPGEMVKTAAEYLDEMRIVLTRVVQLQEIARKQKDVIKLNCVNDKLLQVKQLMNIGEAAKTNLDEAIARSDDSARYDWFSTLTIASEQVAALGTEAENCIGEDLSFLGPTESTTEGGGEPDDPTQPPELDYPEVEVTPVASPFI